MDEIIMPLLYVVCTWGIPIAVIVAIVKSKKKKEENAKKEAERQAQRKKEAAIEAAEIKRKEEKIQTNHLVDKYKDNPRTLNAAEIFANRFVNLVKGCSRDIRTKSINCGLEIGARIGQAEGSKCTYVGFVSLSRPSISFSDVDFHFHDEGNIINFTSENLRPLQNRMEMEAFVRAIAMRAFDMIKEMYPQDDSGSDYKLTTAENAGIDFDHNYAFSIKFSYSAVNALYSAPAEW